MSGRNSLIDTDFEEEEVGGFRDDELPSGKAEETQVEVVKPEDIDIEVVDDTPDEDKGKWTADNVAADDDEDEKKKYGKSVRERIAKETAKVHAERRAKEERERQLNEATSLLRKMIKENNDLKGLVENGEKVLVSEHQGRLESQLAAAKVSYREAHEAGDVNGQIAAQETLAKIAAQMDRLSTHRVNPIQRMDEKEVDRLIAPVQVNQGPDQSALDWKEQNRWFMKDEAMTAYAMAYHNRLAQEGIEPRDGEKYWKAIDKEMRQRFPERFDAPQRQQAQPRRSDTIVAAASRAGAGTARTKVTLTESQVRLAKRLGLTPQQYAEQVVAEGNSKDWTHG